MPGDPIRVPQTLFRVLQNYLKYIGYIGCFRICRKLLRVPCVKKVWEPLPYAKQFIKILIAIKNIRTIDIIEQYHIFWNLKGKTLIIMLLKTFKK